jgi:hypothetical protein
MDDRGAEQLLESQPLWLLRCNGLEIPGIVNPCHPNAGSRATGEAEQATAPHRVAKALGKQRQLIGCDRLAHLAAQGRVRLHMGRKLLQRASAHST